MTPAGLLVALVAVTAGVVLALAALPVLGPLLSNTLFGAEPKGYWYLARVAGLTSYGLVWLSVVFGLLVTNRLGRLWPGGPATVDLHQFLSLFALGYVVFHALVLLGDRYMRYSLPQLLIPFAGGAYRPVEVGLGQLALYLLFPLTFSFYARRWLGQRGWRALHYSAFLVYALATIHGIMSGTDSSHPAILALYGSTVLLTLALTLYRILVTGPQTRAAQPRSE